MLRHRPSHWIAVAAVLLGALLMLGEAHGQSTWAEPLADGRPAQAAVPAGSDQPRPPEKGDRRLAERDTGIAKDNRSAVRVAKRGVRRTIERARGIAQLDLG